MLDLSAAFNTIYDNCRFYKLCNYFGITGNALKWLTLYLTKRSSEVVIDNVYILKIFYKFVFPKDLFLDLNYLFYM